MLRGTVVIGLLAITLAYIMVDRDNKKVIENEDYSWEEAKGHEECEEFVFWRKDAWKKGDWEGMKKDWDGDKKNWESNDVDSDEGRYKGENDNEQYGFDSDEDNEGRSRHHQHLHGCPKPKPLDEICAKIECPKFEKLNISGCGFEARNVYSARWIQTQLNISDIAGDWVAAYSRLDNYITGANDGEVQLNMTAPVLGMWYLDEKYQLADGYLLFYIPSAFQDDPPEPTDSAVWVVTLSDAVLYDRAFGCRDLNVYTQEFELLWQALQKQNITIYPYMSLTAEWTPAGPGAQRIEALFIDNGSM